MPNNAMKQLIARKGGILSTGTPPPTELVVVGAMETVLTGSAYRVVRALVAATLPDGDTDVASLLLPSGAT